MMGVEGYPTKKSLRESVGKPLRVIETSVGGPEYKSDGDVFVVGPHPYKRDWYAKVTMKGGLIARVT